MPLHPLYDDERSFVAVPSGRLDNVGVFIKGVWICPDGSGRVCVATSQHGVIVWTASGEEEYFNPTARDGVWSWDGEYLYILTDGSFVGRPAQPNVILKVRPNDGLIVQNVPVNPPSGGCERLSPCPTSDRTLVTWVEQSHWGYLEIDLAIHGPTGVRLAYGVSTNSLPRYSPDGSCIVACHKVRDGWWCDPSDLDLDTEQEYQNAPSRGGRLLVGVITIDNIDGMDIESHLVFTDLPAGWVPTDGDDPTWSALIGPMFTDERKFNVRLPDGSVISLILPLNGPIVLPNTLSTIRLDIIQ